jgi:hypothetical protein
MSKKIIVDCACGENRYMRFWKFDDEDIWYVSLSYQRISLYQRLKYIWFVLIKGEDWDTFIIRDKDIKKLEKNNYKV